MSDPVGRRSYNGPAVLSWGFRPFFLAGALWAGVAVVAWLPVYFGKIIISNAFQPMDWHAHEALFGYGGAVIAGFLLTAVPNWTGRLPLQGRPLLLLVLVWFAGRVAVACSGTIGWAAAAAVDCAFLALLCAAIAREIVAGRNWRNLRIWGAVVLLLAANVLFHLEAHLTGDAAYSRRFALAVIVVLVMLIGGRIVPSFTHTFLLRQGAVRLPRTFDRFDGISMAVSCGAMVGWIIAPENQMVGLALIAASGTNFARLSRWAGNRASSEVLVAILHVAYAFVPIGFLLSGLAAFVPTIPLSAGLHAWAVGAIGGMTLAVMTRASLGHTGRALYAGWGTQILYAALLLAVMTRIGAALVPQWNLVLLLVAASAWLVAFLGFAAIYGPALVRPRL